MSGKTPAEGRQAAFVEASGLPVLWKPFLPHQVIEIVEQRARR